MLKLHLEMEEILEDIVTPKELEVSETIWVNYFYIFLENSFLFLLIQLFNNNFIAS